MLIVGQTVQINRNMLMLIFAVALMLASNFCHVYAGKSYHIQLDRFEPFSNTEKEFFDPGTLRISRKARNHFVMSGEFTLHKNLGDEIALKYQVSRKANNGKYTQVLQGGNTLCLQIMNDTLYYPQIAQVSTIPNPAQCPFPKNTYVINNFEVPEDFLPQIAPPGDYLSDVQFLLDGEVIFGYKVYVTIIPG